MMTNDEVGHLNEILPELPTEGRFRISGLIRSLFSDPEYFLYPGDIETEVRRTSNEITNFLVSKGLANYDGDFFFDNLGNNEYQSRQIEISEAGKTLQKAGTYQAFTKNLFQEPDPLKRLDWVLHFMAIHAVQGRGIECLDRN